MSEIPASKPNPRIHDITLPDGKKRESIDQKVVITRGEYAFYELWRSLKYNITKIVADITRLYIEKNLEPKPEDIFTRVGVALDKQIDEMVGLSNPEYFNSDITFNLDYEDEAQRKQLEAIKQIYYERLQVWTQAKKVRSAMAETVMANLAVANISGGAGDYNPFNWDTFNDMLEEKAAEDDGRYGVDLREKVEELFLGNDLTGFARHDEGDMDPGKLSTYYTGDVFIAPADYNYKQLDLYFYADLSGSMGAGIPSGIPGKSAETSMALLRNFYKIVARVLGDAVDSGQRIRYGIYGFGGRYTGPAVTRDYDATADSLRQKAENNNAAGTSNKYTDDAGQKDTAPTAFFNPEGLMVIKDIDTELRTSQVVIGLDLVQQNNGNPIEYVVDHMCRIERVGRNKTIAMVVSDGGLSAAQYDKMMKDTPADLPVIYVPINWDEGSNVHPYGEKIWGSYFPKTIEETNELIGRVLSDAVMTVMAEE